MTFTLRPFAIILAGTLVISAQVAAATLSAAVRGQATAASIRGAAWQDDNGDGQRQQSEAARANLPIALRQEATGQTFEASTNPVGEYEFSDLEPGSYSVQIAVGTEARRYMTFPTRAVDGLATIRANVSEDAVIEVDLGIYPDSKVPRFLGTVSIEGQPAASPPDVRALIDGQNCSLADPLRPPGASVASYHIAVLPAELAPGCGVTGKTVAFTVNGRAANETATWQPGTPADRTTSLALTVGSAPSLTATPQPSGPQPSATITPPDTGSGGLR